MKALRRVSILVTIGILATGGAAAADGVYHSERLSFAGGANPAFHGQVVNIHPMDLSTEPWSVTRSSGRAIHGVRGVDPVLRRSGLHGLHADRGPDYGFPRQGHASAGFSAADLAPFSGVTVTIRWVLRVDRVSLRDAVHHRDHRLTPRRRISRRSREPADCPQRAPTGAIGVALMRRSGTEHRAKSADRPHRHRRVDRRRTPPYSVFGVWARGE